MRQYKVNPGYIYHKMIHFKRFWITRPRSLKPALVLLSLLAVTIMVNSVLLIGRKTQQGTSEDFITVTVASGRSPPAILPLSQEPLQASVSQYWVPSTFQGKMSPLLISKDKWDEGVGYETVRIEDGDSSPLKWKPIRQEKVKDENESKLKKSITKVLSGQDQVNGPKNVQHFGLSGSHSSHDEQKPKKSMDELSFGFVNPNFKPPVVSQASLVDIKEMVDMSSKKNTGMNPGSLVGSVIGAVVSVKKFMSNDGTSLEDSQSKVKSNSEIEVISKNDQVVEKTSKDVSGNNVHEGITISASDLNTVPRKQNKDKGKQKHLESLQEKTTNRHSKGSIENSNSMGSVISKLGPSLISAALGSDKKSSQGSSFASILGGVAPALLLAAGATGGVNNPNQSGKTNAMYSLINKVGSSFLSGGLSKNTKDNVSGVQASVGSSQPNLFQSLASGVGPALLAGVLGNGLSLGKQTPVTGQSQHSEVSNPMQSLMNGIGPALAGSVMQTMLGVPENRSGTSQNSKGSGSITSIVSGLAPALLAGAIGQGFIAGEGRSNSAENNPSPLQSLVGGLGPAVLKAVGQSFGGSKDANSAPSPLGSIISNVAPMLMGNAMVKKQKGKSKVIRNSNDDKPQNMSPYMALKDTSARDIAKAVPVTDVPSDEDGDDDVTDNHGFANSWMLKTAVKTVVGSVLPDRISIPEVNSTKGLWHMAVNLALGNPRDKKGKQSQFWNWLREYGGESNSSGPNSGRIPTWLKKALAHPDRTSHAGDIQEFHRVIKQFQPICQRVAMVGGTFNWKRNAMEDENTLCLDNDVAPHRDDCLVYAFGLSQDWVFEETMEKMGCQVYVFDPHPTTGNHNHSMGIHFYNVGLSYEKSTTVREEGQFIIPYFTLPAILSHFGHQQTNIVYLKMDLGGTEWKVLQQIIEEEPQAIANVKQLNLEVNLNRALEDPTLYGHYLKILSTLESLGFQLFSAQPNMSENNKVFIDPLLEEEVWLKYQMVYLRI